MANTFPESIVMRSSASQRNLRFITEPAGQRGFVTSWEENVFEPFAKIAVERAKVDSRFIHLRFSHTNKYWARASRDRNNSWILANSNQPEEDTSKLSCTMFEPITTINSVTFVFRHVQSGGLVRMNPATGNRNIFVEDASVPHNLTNQLIFTFVDWDTLVRLPRHVAFKGFNDRYIRHVVGGGNNFNQFSSEDPNCERSGYEIILHPDGHIRVRSNIVGRFWRRSPNWIWSDSTDNSGTDINTLFWPVKVSDNAIALRNAGNNRFCSILSANGYTNNLNAAVNTITREARLTVRELVLDRSIFNVRFRMEDARIYDEQASIAGIGCPINESEKAAKLTVTIGYEDTSSFTFSNGLSLSAGVSTTIRTGIPRIAEGEISVSAEVTTSFEWNRTTEESRNAEAAYEVVVPPKSRVRVHFISTRGTCSVPFSYTQRDRSSTNGNFTTTNHTDGIYTGINYYSFHFEKHAIEPL
ncbi:uncharacterized protein LOC126653961 [Mercurialis annua]|uniref:uncharacterized protein LOC126653961 n=1 Tax=Mercurialis annua TaxID=3986 RepID=UPI00215E8FC7|nr:uncharacterized protein LOC126653961 [Mercurialis annua]XP_050203924.1 uncharacterized protein LOC126653961 [Mercurialis annua]